MINNKQHPLPKIYPIITIDLFKYILMNEFYCNNVDATSCQPMTQQGVTKQGKNVYKHINIYVIYTLHTINLIQKIDMVVGKERRDLSLKMTCL